MAAITAGVITAVAAVGSAVSQRNAARAQSRSQRIEQRRADIANARERRTVVRNARVARAQIEAQASLTGQTGSSTVAGATSGVQQQLGSNLSFLDQNQQLSAQATAANISAARYLTQASTWATLGNSFGAVATQFDGVGKNKQPGAD